MKPTLHEEIRVRHRKRSVIQKLSYLSNSEKVKQVLKKEDPNSLNVAYRSLFEDGKTIDVHLIFTDNRLMIDAEGFEDLSLPLTSGGIKKLPKLFKKFRALQIDPNVDIGSYKKIELKK